MIGCIVKHSGFGLGRVIQVERGHVRVLFFSSGDVHSLTGGFHRIPLGLGTRCTSDNKICHVRARRLGKGWQELNRYEVQFEADGRLDELPESAITPDTGSSLSI